MRNLTTTVVTSSYLVSNMKIYGKIEDLYICKNPFIKKKLDEAKIFPIKTIKKILWTEWHYVSISDIEKIVKGG